MKAIIHCGGKGTRLADISKSIPKPMVVINGKPLLFWHIKNLKKYNITDIYITLHHLPEKIIDYFGDGRKFGVSITYSFEKNLLGTGGGLLPLAKYINTDTFVLYGDVASDINYNKLLTFHNDHQAYITVVIHHSIHPEDSDLVTFDNTTRLTSIFHKPHITIPKFAYNLAALYVFSPKAFKYLPKKTPFDISHDVLPRMLKKKKPIFCYDTQEFMIDIGTKERLRKVQNLLTK